MDAEILIILCTLFGAIIFFIWMRHLDKRAKEHSLSYPSIAMKFAKNIASSQWTIEKIDKTHDSILILVLQHRSWSNQKAVLYGRPEHPDYERFQALHTSEVVDFQTVEKPVYPFMDVAAHLRLGEVSEAR